jgi:hypothetical protein
MMARKSALRPQAFQQTQTIFIRHGDIKDGDIHITF